MGLRLRRETRSVAGSMFLGCRCGVSARAVQICHTGRWNFLGKSTTPSRPVARCCAHNGLTGASWRPQKIGQGSSGARASMAGGGRTKEAGGGERARERPKEEGRGRRAGAGKTSGRRCRWRDTCSSREPATAARAVTQLATTIHIRPTSPNVAFFLDITSLSPPTPPREAHSAHSTQPLAQTVSRGFRHPGLLD